MASLLTHRATVSVNVPPHGTDEVTPMSSTSKHRPILSVKIPQCELPIQYQGPGSFYPPPHPTPLWVSNFQPAPPNMMPWIRVTLDSPVHFPPSLGFLPLNGPNGFVPPISPPGLPPPSGFAPVPYREQLNPVVTHSYYSTPPLPTRPTMMPGNYTMDAYGFGREAKALEPKWANLVLKGFTRKYPLTGTQCQTAISVCSSGTSTPAFHTPETSPPSSPGPMSQPYSGASVLPHPAVIQQKLEELLLKKKEKKLMLVLQRAGF